MKRIIKILAAYGLKVVPVLSDFTKQKLRDLDSQIRFGQRPERRVDPFTFKSVKTETGKMLQYSEATLPNSGLWRIYQVTNPKTNRYSYVAENKNLSQRFWFNTIYDAKNLSSVVEQLGNVPKSTILNYLRQNAYELNIKHNPNVHNVEFR